MWKPELRKHFSSDRTNTRTGIAQDCVFEFSLLLPSVREGSGEKETGEQNRKEKSREWGLKFSISAFGDLSGGRSSALPSSNLPFSVPTGLGSPFECLAQTPCVLPSPRLSITSLVLSTVVLVPGA